MPSSRRSSKLRDRTHVSYISSIGRWVLNHYCHLISLFIIGDWTANVGSQEILGVTGKFGIGVQNEAGQRPTEFCQENTPVIANTLFQHHTPVIANTLLQ